MKILNTLDIKSRFWVVVFSLIFLIACDKPIEPKTETSRPIKIMTLGNTEGNLRLEYPGVVAVVTTVKLGFEVPGRIIELPIRAGQDVVEGALLGRLDSMNYKAERDSAASHRQAMDAAYKRAKNIFDQNAGSQATVDDSLRNIQVANEDLKKAQKALDDTYLKAPFSGQIADKFVDNFQNVRAKQPVLLLHNLNTLKIEITVPEKDIARGKSNLSYEQLTKKMAPVVTVSALSDQSFPAILYSFTTSADPTTRTYTASFRFSNTSDQNILPGMTAKLSIFSMHDDIEQNTIEIPVSAVITDKQNHPSVWRVAPDTMQVSQVPVELGILHNKSVVILNGLKQGDDIAVSGVHHLREGMTVYPLKK